MTKTDLLEKWIEEMVGCGYVYGATGWVCSEARRKQQAEQYPNYQQIIMNTCAKWDGIRCFDCAQLIVQGAKAVGITGLPSGATSLWKKVEWADQGEIGTIPSGKLVCVFRDSNGTKQHIGWRLRNGDVIDARGSSDGVVRNKPYNAGWTHWALLPGLDDEQKEEEPVQIATVIGGRLKMRKNPQATAPIVRYLETNSTVMVLEEGAVWCRVRYSGSEGWCMSEFLDGVNNAEPQETDMVTFTLPKSFYEQLKSYFL